MIPIRTPEDGLIVAMMLAAMIPVSSLCIVACRRFRLAVRVGGVVLFQLGGAVALVWLLTKFGWSPVWQAANQMLRHNLIGWTFYGLYMVSLGSPVITALVLWDCFRYSRGREIDRDRPLFVLPNWFMS